ncbi:MAG: hypothetical protein SNJ73_06060 [Acetobacteraceae bacterium]
MFGYRFGPAGLTVDVGGIACACPGADAGAIDDHVFEVATRLSCEIGPATLRAAFHWSPEVRVEFGDGHCADGGIDLDPPFQPVPIGRLGHRWIDGNDRFGPKDVANRSSVLARELHGVAFAIGHYDTRVRKCDCPKGVGGSDVCEARAIASVRLAF